MPVILTQKFVVIAGLDPAIHSVAVEDNGGPHGMDAMVKPWHDDSGKQVSAEARS
jgi:hypothetical protein